jgi:copper homeostasis protein
VADGLTELTHARSGGGQVRVTAGGGVRVADVPALVAAGVDAVHLSARRPAHDVGAAGPGGGASGYDVTDEATVRDAVAAARGLGAPGGAARVTMGPTTAVT